MKKVVSWFGALAVLGSLVNLAAAQAGPGHGHDPAPPHDGVVVLVPFKDSKVSGTITLKQTTAGVKLEGEVSGLKPGKHGFHIHMFGDLRAPDGISAGGHFNPDGHMHGGLNAKDHHAGDLGNLEADDKGVAKVDVTAPDVKMHFILGRSLVVHADADDLKSQPAGNSGPRIAVGVIGIAEVKQPAAAGATPAQKK